MNAKKIGIGLAAFVVAFFVIGFLLPKNIYVEHEEHIVAAPKMIFVFVGDFQNWPKWSPWAQKDPAMTVEYSAPSYGVDATQTWSSAKMGKGTAKMTSWSVDNQLSYQMQIEDWPASIGTMTFSFPSQGAIVKWTMEGPLKSTAPHWRWMGLIMRFFIKRDFKEGLANLKKLCEASSAADVNGPWHTEAAKPQSANAKKPSTPNVQKPIPPRPAAGTPTPPAGTTKAPGENGDNSPGTTGNKPPAILPMPSGGKPPGAATPPPPVPGVKPAAPADKKPAKNP